jgi:hypothetical protein
MITSITTHDAHHCGTARARGRCVTVSRAGFITIYSAARIRRVPRSLHNNLFCGKD